ncbi:pilus assembly PilX family protein [Sedimenticola sp.]|uniref:pilus assembly PilX family protein n=1 Tax=Sedimenticola sp. TaxID=1940285 RepID=UPI003D0D98E2
MGKLTVLGLTSSRSLPNQKGAVLVVSLVILVALTLIGITGLQVTSLEERMSGFQLDQNIAMQAAEAALVDAEQYIQANINAVTIGNINATAGLYNKGAAPDPFVAASWSNANSIEFSGTFDTDGAANGTVTDPRFFIEVRDSFGDDSGAGISLEGYGGDSSGSGEVTQFRITARGTGRSDTTQVFLQVDYGKRVN